MERVYTAPLLDKLGVRPGMRVAIVGDLDVDPEAAVFRRELADRTGDVTEGRPKLDSDLRPAGAIWVVSRKGKTKTLRDVEVMAAAKERGLVDNKVVAFSAERTSIRLVIPVALRPRG